ncbi:MAG: cell division protein SepF [Clostridiales bacterium]|nr:cell division protein SepF [Clostridiales bacterium]
MGIFGKIKDAFNVSEERYFEESEDMLTEGEDYREMAGNPGRRGDRGYYREEPEQQYPTREYSVKDNSNVVNMRAQRENVFRNSSMYGSNVVFQKIDRFSDVGGVADILNEGKIVILNLETCPDLDSRRILDFLYGVSYANDGIIKRVAGRAYVFTPRNVEFTGEMLDEIQSNGTFNPNNAFPGDFTFDGQ